MTTSNRSIILLTLLIASAILASAAAYAQSDAPVIPAFFYGKAAVNGRSVPVDSYVIAKIDGAKQGQIKITVAGAYGSETTDQKLAVSGSRSSLGKDIEFYVKLPKLKEIKATQVFPWQPGEINKLDLTFTGEEIVDNSTNETIIEELPLNSTKEQFTYEKIIAGKQIMMLLSSIQIPILRLQLITNTNLSNVTFEFETVEAISVPKLEGTYKYISITASKIKESDVKTAILRFMVPNEWFEKNNYNPATVKLYRYSSNKWVALETVNEGNDADNNYYRASTPGFSYFAIKAEKQVAEEPEKKEEAKITDLSGPEKPKTEVKRHSLRNETGLGQITGNAVEKVKANPIIGVGLVLAGMLSGILLTYYFVVKRKKQEHY